MDLKNISFDIQQISEKIEEIFIDFSKEFPKLLNSTKSSSFDELSNALESLKTENSLSSNERYELSSLSSYCDYSYQTLYTLSNELDTTNNTDNISNSLKNLLTYLENSHQKAGAIQFSTPASTLSANIKGAIEIIKSVPQTPTSSDLRYAYCSILLSRV